MPPPAGVAPVRPVRPRVAVHEVYGRDDPLGTALTRALDVNTGLDLSGHHAPHSLRYGMKGGPLVSFRGDLGPLQQFDGQAVGKAPRGVRAGMKSANALPNSKGSIVPITATQDMLGPGPL